MGNFVSRSVAVKRSNWVEFCEVAERVVHKLAGSACSGCRTDRLFVYQVAIPGFKGRAVVATRSNSNRVRLYFPPMPWSPCEAAIHMSAEVSLGIQLVASEQFISEGYTDSHRKYGEAYTEVEESPPLALTQARIAELPRAQVNELLSDIAVGLRYDTLLDGDVGVPEYSVEDAMAANGTMDFSQMVVERFHALQVQL